MICYIKKEAVLPVYSIDRYGEEGVIYFPLLSGPFKKCYGKMIQKKIFPLGPQLLRFKAIISLKRNDKLQDIFIGSNRPSQ